MKQQIWKPILIFSYTHNRRINMHISLYALINRKKRVNSLNIKTVLAYSNYLTSNRTIKVFALMFTYYIINSGPTVETKCNSRLYTFHCWVITFFNTSHVHLFLMTDLVLLGCTECAHIALHFGEILCRSSEAFHGKVVLLFLFFLKYLKIVLLKTSQVTYLVWSYFLLL